MTAELVDASAPATLPEQPRQTWSRVYARRLVVSDAVLLLWAFVGAHIVWNANPVWRERSDPMALRWVVLSASLYVIWMALLGAGGAWDRRVVGSGPTEYKRVANSALSIFAIIAFLGYVTSFDVPRSYVFAILPLGFVALTVSRWLWRQWLIADRAHGGMSAATVVVGGRRSLERLVMDLQGAPRSGYRIVGACVTDATGLATVRDVPVVGGVYDIVEAVRVSGADTVIVASSDAAHPDMVRRLGWNLEGLGVDLIVAPALANIAGPRVHARPVAGLPLLHVERPAYQGAQRWMKALFDRCGSLALILLTLPVMVPVALAIKLGSKGPVFFVQERAGRDGQTFGMIKFRTMVVGAESMVADLQEQTDAGNTVMFKMKDDPRVTRVGKFLRRYSLDELPQLFNVVKGDMSLVGPRPPLMSEVLGYETDARRRLLVRPGLTGPWQISGRSDLNWEETVRLDLYYVENWSILGDLLILVKTIRAVVSSRGAY